jgi:histidine triad (HIT) family protein
MYNHAPENYKCPICIGIQGVENDDTLIRQTDIVYKDDLVTAFIGSIWVGNNPGHPLVVPNEHYENIYDMPQEVGHRIFDVAQMVAKALKEVRECDGITFVQNSEPMGGQHAFHYHLHIFPRFENDDLHSNMNNSYRPTPEERLQYSEPLKNYLNKEI